LVENWAILESQGNKSGVVGPGDLEWDSNGDARERRIGELDQGVGHCDHCSGGEKSDELHLAISVGYCLMLIQSVIKEYLQQSRVSSI
jgi:hypothetical protein